MAWGEGEIRECHIRWAFVNVQISCGVQWGLPWDARNLGLKMKVKISVCLVCCSLGKLVSTEFCRYC